MWTDADLILHCYMNTEGETGRLKELFPQTDGWQENKPPLCVMIPVGGKHVRVKTKTLHWILLQMIISLNLILFSQMNINFVFLWAVLQPSHMKTDFSDTKPIPSQPHLLPFLFFCLAALPPSFELEWKTFDVTACYYLTQLCRAPWAPLNKQMLCFRLWKANQVVGETCKDRDEGEKEKKTKSNWLEHLDCVSVCGVKTWTNCSTF